MGFVGKASRMTQIAQAGITFLIPCPRRLCTYHVNIRYPAYCRERLRVLISSPLRLFNPRNVVFSTSLSKHTCAKLPVSVTHFSPENIRQVHHYLLTYLLPTLLLCVHWSALSACTPVGVAGPG